MSYSVQPVPSKRHVKASLSYGERMLSRVKNPITSWCACGQLLIISTEKHGLIWEAYYTCCGVGHPKKRIRLNLDMMVLKK